MSARRSRMKQARPVQGQAAPSGARGLSLLLLLTLVAVVAAYASVLAVKLCNAPVLFGAHLAPLALYAATLLIVRLALGATGYRGDAGLVAGAFLLAGIGMVMQLRVGAYAAGFQELLPLALGAGGFLLTVILAGKGRVRHMEHAGWPAYLAALGLMAAVIAFGQRFRGAIFLPGNYNPTEMAKPLLVLFAAAYLCRHREAFTVTRLGLPMPPVAPGAGLLLLWAAPVALTVLLGDLGLSLLMSGVLVVMLYAASRKAGWLIVGCLAVVGLALLGGDLSAHAQVRFAVWRNPFDDPTGRGWQVLRALSALYAGGLWGCGIGAGAPGTVPIVSSDFIYAALGEEIGWAGCALLLVAFGAFCTRGWRAAAAATPFGTIFGAGLTACLAAQTILNVAGVTKALPLTGLTLPFISHGGSSLVTSFVMAGLLAAISEQEQAQGSR